MPPTPPNMPTDLLGGFIWLVSEYRRTFLALTVVFTVSPIALCVLLISVLLGIVDSPMLNVFKEISAQHQQQYNSMTIHSRAILENLAEIKDTKDEVRDTKSLVREVVNGNDKNFKGQVANCFVAADGNREAIDRCKELQRLE